MSVKESSLLQNHLLINMQRERWGRINQQRFRFISRYAGNLILDVGCARGDYVTTLNKRGFRSFGLDLLPYKEWQLSRPQVFIQGDATFLPFPDHTFETILAFEILEHIPNPEKVIQEFSRVCRKNLIISVPDCTVNQDLIRAGLVYTHWLDQSHYNFFDSETFRAILEDNGFNVEIITRINPILPDFIPLRSWHIPFNLAFQLSRLMAHIPLRKQYRMTLLAIANRL
jgi:SAM-dependent methyltransferase